MSTETSTRPGAMASTHSARNVRHLLLPALLVAASFAGCAEEDAPLSVEEIYGTGGIDVAAEAPVDYRDRASGLSYGLPESGQSSVADLIAIYPTNGLGFDDADIWAEPTYNMPTDQCRGGEINHTTALPMTIVGVVSMHPQRFLKITICGQDERHYGSLVIEDDTGGIVILRDSRTAPYTAGDRVRVTVRAALLTFGPETDTRAVVASDIEMIGPTVSENADGERVSERPVLFEETELGFTAASASRTFRVSGYVHQPPTNDNFSQLILTPSPYSVGAAAAAPESLARCMRTCGTRCATDCMSETVCADICADMCPALNPNIDDGAPVVIPEADDIDTCWIASLDVELVRRNFTPDIGEHIQMTGPIVNGFDRNMWIGTTGQIVFLDQE